MNSKQANPRQGPQIFVHEGGTTLAQYWADLLLFADRFLADRTLAIRFLAIRFLADDIDSGELSG
jgi:hypothetical protein